MNTKFPKLLLSVFSLLLIAGCGLKGPLYQPPENQAPVKPSQELNQSTEQAIESKEGN